MLILELFSFPIGKNSNAIISETISNLIYNCDIYRSKKWSTRLICGPRSTNDATNIGCLNGMDRLRTDDEKYWNQMRVKVVVHKIKKIFSVVFIMYNFIFINVSYPFITNNIIITLHI